MKSYGYLTVVALSCAASCYRTQTPPAAPGAVVVFDPATIDLGGQPWNTHATFQLTLRNNGAVPVSIDGVYAGCGCTDVDQHRGEVVAPGASLAIAGKVETGTEDRVRNVKITATASGLQAMATVSVRSIIGYMLSPASVHFGTVDVAGTADPLAVRITGAASYLMDAGPSVSAGSDWVTARFRDDRMLVVCADASGLAVGRSSAVVSVRTTDPHRPIALIPVVIGVTSDLTADPASVILTDSQPVRSVIIADAETQARVAVASVTSSSPAIGATPTTAGEILVRRAEPGRLFATLTIVDASGRMLRLAVSSI